MRSRYSLVRPDSIREYGFRSAAAWRLSHDCHFEKAGPGAALQGAGMLAHSTGFADRWSENLVYEWNRTS